MKTAPATIQIDVIGPQKFTLAVTFDGQRFECGNYISRAAAMQAGRLFVQRKEGGTSPPVVKGLSRADGCPRHPMIMVSDGPTRVKPGPSGHRQRRLRA